MVESGFKNKFSLLAKSIQNSNYPPKKLFLQKCSLCFSLKKLVKNPNFAKVIVPNIECLINFFFSFEF